MKICGIYKITSPSKKVYIGQSIDVIKRWRQYRNGHGKRQTKLNSSLQKYGIERHGFEVICQCDESELNNLEVYYIDLYQSFNSEFGLNLLGGGGSQRHSEETKRKISLAHKGKKRDAETVKKMSQRMLGKKASEETKAKMRAAHKGRHGWVPSDKTRAIWHEQRKGNTNRYGKRKEA